MTTRIQYFKFYVASRSDFQFLSLLNLYGLVVFCQMLVEQLFLQCKERKFGKDSNTSDGLLYSVNQTVKEARLLDC